MHRLALAAIVALALQSSAPEPPPTWETHDVEGLIARAEESGEHWVKFLDRSTLYAGLYRLPAGGTDGQSPHELDEVYYVVKGRSGFEVDGERSEVAPGTILFVAAHAEHRFVDIAEDLEVVVFFSRRPVDEAGGK